MTVRTTLLAFFLAPLALLADPNGKTGRTSTMTQGCGDCHGGNAGAVTSIKLEAPATVLPGSQTTLKVIVNHATNRSAGVSVAIRATPTGMSDGIGTLAPVTGSGLRIRGTGATAELTQSAPKAMSTNGAEFSFTWTAPSKEGVYYVQAIGNAVNGNGREDSGDDWTFLQPVEIKVEAATGVQEDVAMLPSIFPNPCAAAEILNVGTDISGSAVVQIANTSGQILVDETMDIAAGRLPRPLAELPRGVYMILIRQGAVTRQGSVTLW